MKRHPAYQLYTNLLKASLVEPREPAACPEPRVDPARLLEAAKRKFGDGLVCGLAPESLAWLLRVNARRADTLAPPAQLDVLQFCLETAVEESIPGDVIEAGCFRGGQCVLMAGVLKALGAEDRRIWAADSFAGLPQPDAIEAPDDAVFYDLLEPIGRFRSSPDEVQRTFHRYGLLDDRLRIVAGWFRKSLPAAGIGSLALVRLDATFCRSTRDALDILYPKLSRGGFLICADYAVPTGARRAVDEYRLEHGIEEHLVEIDGQGVLWRRKE